MEKELVSIIASVYKGEKYLRECIESVLEQDYHNIELIMVDDGSPDNSGKIMDEYAANDCRMKVIHKENSGVSNSRNIALQHSKGKYVCLLDQDDVLAIVQQPDPFRTQCFQMLFEVGYDASLCCQFLLFGDTEEIIGIMLLSLILAI